MKQRTGRLPFLVQALLLILLFCLAMAAHAEDGAVHEWDGGVVTTPATCTSDGVRTYTCTRPGCGATYTESIPAKGHSPETLPAVPASCETPGKAAGKRCSVCGEILESQDTIPATGHDWGPWKEGSESTCEARGKDYSVCAKCGVTRFRDIREALGHDWDEGVVIKEATTTEEGEILYTCKRDPSHTKTETIPVKEEEELPDAHSVMNLLRSGVPVVDFNSFNQTDEGLSALLTPTVPLQIVTQPAGGLIEREDDRIVLSIEVTGGKEPYTYEWRRKENEKKTGYLALQAGASLDLLQADIAEINGKIAVTIGQLGEERPAKAFGMSKAPVYMDRDPLELKELSFSETVGENAPTFEAERIGTYYCIVTDDNGNSRISDEAVVDFALYIEEQPNNANIFGKDSVTLRCIARGGEPFDNGTYMFAWYDASGSMVDFTDDGTATVTEEGEYYCMVQDLGDGLITSKTCTVYSTEPLKVESSQDTCYIVPEEENADLSMTVTGGVPPYTYTWYSPDGTILDSGTADGAGSVITQNISDLGKYICQVTDSMREEQSDAVSVEYRQLEIAQQPQSGILGEDGYYDLHIGMASGTPPFTYMLYRNDDLIDYTDDTPRVAYSGEYYFHVEDAKGRWADSDKAFVSDYEFGIDRIDTPDGDALSSPKDALKLEAVLKAETKDVTYRWTWKSTAADKKSETLPETGKTCTATLPGKYSCTAINSDWDMDYAHVYITYAGQDPVFVQQPKDIVLRIDKKGYYNFCLEALAVTADGQDDCLKYEWRLCKDNEWTTVAGCRVFDQTLNHDPERYCGEYYCKVTDTRTGRSSDSQKMTITCPMDNGMVIKTYANKKDYYVNLEYDIKGGEPPFDVILYEMIATKRTSTNPDEFDYFETIRRHFKTDKRTGNLTIIRIAYLRESKNSIAYNPRYYFVITDKNGQKYMTSDFDYSTYLSN